MCIRDRHTLHKTTSVESLELDELMEISSRFLGQDSMPQEDLGPIRIRNCLLYTSPSPRDRTRSRMPSSA